MKIELRGGRQRRLADKVALVTGGASGIGRATWARFIVEGAKLVVTDIDTSIEPAIGKLGDAAMFLHHDVRDEAAWRDVISATRARFGRLDILVNCAGILREGTIESTTLDDWRNVLAVNVDGTFFGCQATLPLLRESGDGSIINLSSVSGIKGDASLVAYDASKGAVRNLTKEVALHCAHQNYGIRCNSVHPGIVKTRMVEEFFDSAQSVRFDDWMATQPNGRVIEPEEVAEMILFLASSDSSFVTGAEFTIDGGATA